MSVQSLFSKVCKVSLVSEGVLSAKEMADAEQDVQMNWGTAFFATVHSVGSKIHASGREGGWYLISGLGHKISCQTRNTIESLLKVKVARTRT